MSQNYVCMRVYVCVGVLYLSHICSVTQNTNEATETVPTKAIQIEARYTRIDREYKNETHGHTRTHDIFTIYGRCRGYFVI